MIEAAPGRGRPLVATPPSLGAEAVYAARYEMAASVDDVLSRRTRARLLARDASAAAALDVARLIAPDLGWSADDVAAQVAAYLTSVATERESAGLPETAPHAAVGA